MNKLLWAVAATTKLERWDRGGSRIIVPHTAATWTGLHVDHARVCRYSVINRPLEQTSDNASYLKIPLIGPINQPGQLTGLPPPYNTVTSEREFGQNICNIRFCLPVPALIK